MIESIIVVDYITEDGRNPFRQWYAKLRDIEAAVRIRARLARLRVGNFGNARSVGKGVSELRIDYGPGYRIYFARHGDTVVVLLCGGDKGSQSKDIELAHLYWADFKRRLS